MWGQVLTITFLFISALAVSLRKFYLESPLIEPSSGQPNPALKRRTVKSTKREHVLSGLLTIVAVICFSLFAVMLLAYVPKIAYFLLLVISVFWVFFYLPGKNTGRIVADLAGLLTPPLIFLLNKTKNQTKNLEKYFRNRAKTGGPGRFMTKTEILEVLNQQKTAYDGRSLAKGLNLAINSLNFGSKRIEDLAVPLTDVHVIGAQETAGPILIDELHKSGRQYFPVKSPEDGIIGSVKLVDLVDLSDGGKAIKDALQAELYYLDEQDNILAALEKYITSGASMFIVMSDKKTTGVLYLEDLIKEIVED